MFNRNVTWKMTRRHRSRLNRVHRPIKTKLKFVPSPYFCPSPSTLLNEVLATPMERIRGYTAIKTPTKDLLRKECTGKRRAENKEEEGTEAGQMRRRRVGAGKWQLEQLRVIAPRLAQRGHKPPPEVCRATGCPSYAESKEEILIRDARRRATTVISPHARNCV